jgi:4'-phosphopantetheinyl transferase
VGRDNALPGDGPSGGRTTNLGHVATCWLAELSMWSPALDEHLDGAERARADRYRSTDDRRRFVLGVALLKRVAGVDTVVRTCHQCGGPHGRPLVPGSGLHVSVAHAGAHVAVATTTAGPVGIDIERTDRAVPPAGAVVAPGEPVTRPEDLFVYWCRKESVVKATGDGLRVSLTDVHVSPADRPACLLDYRNQHVPACLTDLDLPSGLVGALTVLGPARVDATVVMASARLLEGGR